MASKTNYWSHREHQAKRWIKNNLADDDAMQREILARYKEASKSIQAEINREYMAYAKATGYNMADAMDDVKGEDVQAFAETAARMVQDRDFSDQANARLKLYNATMRINKLEYLKSMIGVEMTKATSKAENDIYTKVQQGYADEYQRQAGILTEYANDFDPSRVINNVLKSYSPRDFSTSVWQSQDLLKTKLDQALTQGLIRGLNPRRIAKELMPAVNTAMQSAAYAAERIARTEMAHAQNMAQVDSFHNNGVDKVVWIAEPSACDECAAHDDKVYKLDEQPELPAHPNCRCALAADPDWAGLDKEIDEYLAAKNSVISRPIAAKADATQQLRDQASAAFDKTNAKEMFGAERYEQFKASLGKINDEQLLKMYARYGDQVEFAPIAEGRAFAKLNVVHLEPSSFTGDRISAPMQTVYHEIGHAIDSQSMTNEYGINGMKTGGTQKVKMGRKTLTFDEVTRHRSGDPQYNLKNVIFDDLWNAATDGKIPSPNTLGKRPRKKAEKEAWQAKSSEIYPGYQKVNEFISDRRDAAKAHPIEYADVSDMVEGTGLYMYGSSYPWGAGHGSSYWKNYGKQQTEFIAEYTSARAASPESLAMIQKIFPNACKVADQILNDIVGG